MPIYRDFTCLRQLSYAKWTRSQRQEGNKNTINKARVHLLIAVSSVRVTSLPDHSYNQMSKSIAGQSSVVFQVMACRDAHVALTQQFNNLQSPTYEIIIGGNNNRNSFIRNGIGTAEELYRVDTPDVLDCNSYRTFWVRWNTDNKLGVGRGAIVGRNQFMDWVDPQKRTFSGLTISTYYDQPGLWDFSFVHGKGILFLLHYCYCAENTMH